MITFKCICFLSNDYKVSNISFIWLIIMATICVSCGLPIQDPSNIFKCRQCATHFVCKSCLSKEHNLASQTYHTLYQVNLKVITFKFKPKPKNLLVLIDESYTNTDDTTTYTIAIRARYEINTKTRAGKKKRMRNPSRNPWQSKRLVISFSLSFMSNFSSNRLLTIEIEVG